MIVDSPLRIFVSYAREDRRWVTPEDPHALIPWLNDSLRRECVVFWYDQRLVPSEEFTSRIHEEINRAQIAVLLVSQAFLNSTFIEEHEMRWIQKRALEGKLLVVPILVGSCDWAEDAFLHQRQVLPRSTVPLIRYIDKEAAWDEIRYEILEGLKHLVRKARNGEALRGIEATALRSSSVAPRGGEASEVDARPSSTIIPPSPQVHTRPSVDPSSPFQEQKQPAVRSKWRLGLRLILGVPMTDVRSEVGWQRLFMGLYLAFVAYALVLLPMRFRGHFSATGLFLSLGALAGVAWFWALAVVGPTRVRQARITLIAALVGRSPGSGQGWFFECFFWIAFGLVFFAASAPEVKVFDYPAPNARVTAAAMAFVLSVYIRAWTLRLDSDPETEPLDEPRAGCTWRWAHLWLRIGLGALGLMGVFGALTMRLDGDDDWSVLLACGVWLILLACVLGMARKAFSSSAGPEVGAYRFLRWLLAFPVAEHWWAWTTNGLYLVALALNVLVWLVVSFCAILEPTELELSDGCAVTVGSWALLALFRWLSLACGGGSASRSPRRQHVRSLAGFAALGCWVGLAAMLWQYRSLDGASYFGSPWAADKSLERYEGTRASLWAQAKEVLDSEGAVLGQNTNRFTLRGMVGPNLVWMEVTESYPTNRYWLQIQARSPAGCGNWALAQRLQNMVAKRLPNQPP